MRQSYGRIETIVGPMFSGKTTELQRRLNRHVYRPLTNPKIAVIKSMIDSRYDQNSIVSHVGHKLKADFQTKNLMDIVDDLGDYDVIGIDEGHFFPGDLVEFCEELSNSGKTVIVSALDTDYTRKHFSHVTELMAKSESVVKLNAICRYCESDAAFTLKKPKEIKSVGSFEVGGSETYESVCRHCHRKKNKMT